MLGWHLVFSTYGFWLPNDPRGSGSTCVRATHIYDVGGEATKVHTTHSVARRRHDVRARMVAKDALKFPPVVLSGRQARAAARGIGDVVPKVNLAICAFAIMPEHVHVVAARHRLDGDEIIACLKRAGTRGMNDEGMHPLANYSRKSGKHPSPWAEGGWKVILDSDSQMLDRIRYVEENPPRAGLPQQRWSFVVPFVG